METRQAADPFGRDDVESQSFDRWATAPLTALLTHFGLTDCGGLSVKHCTALPVEQWPAVSDRSHECNGMRTLGMLPAIQYVSTRSTYVGHALWHYLVTYLVATH